MLNPSLWSVLIRDPSTRQVSASSLCMELLTTIVVEGYIVRDLGRAVLPDMSSDSKRLEGDVRTCGSIRYVCSEREPGTDYDWSVSFREGNLIEGVVIFE